MLCPPFSVLECKFILTFSLFSGVPLLGNSFLQGLTWPFFPSIQHRKEISNKICHSVISLLIKPPIQFPHRGYHINIFYYMSLHLYFFIFYTSTPVYLNNLSSPLWPIKGIQNIWLNELMINIHCNCYHYNTQYAIQICFCFSLPQFW